jgi:CBS domain containing-hemolysin-like protein
VAPRQIDVNARIDISELNERFHLQLPEGDYNTLGGLIIDRLGHIPKRSETVDMPTCVLVILSAYRKKINWVRIQMKPFEAIQTSQDNSPR